MIQVMATNPMIASDSWKLLEAGLGLPFTQMDQEVHQLCWIYQAFFLAWVDLTTPFKKDVPRQVHGWSFQCVISVTLYNYDSIGYKVHVSSPSGMQVKFLSTKNTWCFCDVLVRWSPNRPGGTPAGRHVRHCASRDAWRTDLPTMWPKICDPV